MPNFTESNPFSEWYSTPLSFDDIIAGGVLVVLSIVFIPLNFIVALVMLREDKEIIGFRYLVSSSITDFHCMLTYGFLNGIAILFKDPLIFSNWVWFSFCFHFPLVAWSRFSAVQFPYLFRNQSRSLSYGLCASAHFGALILTVSTVFQPWHVVFYFEPAMYGMLAEDFGKYLREGQSLMYFVIHGIVIGVPIFLYGLLVPCGLGTAIFLLGQIAITIGTGTGKWATWIICFLFFIQSAINCILLLIFSSFLRNRLLQLIRINRTLPFPSDMKTFNVKSRMTMNQ